MGKAESYGIPADSIGALRWLEAAARQKHADAMTLVAYAYEFGLGTAVNPAIAARWWRRLADRGDPDALHRLGTIALNSGLKPQAAHWFRRAAECGDGLALRYLRDLAADGIAEAALDPATELQILERAAEAGDSVAIEALGLRYAEGDGVARDTAKALAYLRRAAADEKANGRSGTATSALVRVESALHGPPPGG
jgi:TPR repeat protein